MAANLKFANSHRKNVKLSGQLIIRKPFAVWKEYLSKKHYQNKARINYPNIIMVSCKE